jgi:hypothetical protein
MLICLHSWFDKALMSLSKGSPRTADFGSATIDNMAIVKIKFAYLEAASLDAPMNLILK